MCLPDFDIDVTGRIPLPILHKNLRPRGEPCHSVSPLHIYIVLRSTHLSLIQSVCSRRVNYGFRAQFPCPACAFTRDVFLTRATQPGSRIHCISKQQFYRLNKHGRSASGRHKLRIMQSFKRYPSEHRTTPCQTKRLTVCGGITNGLVKLSLQK